MQINLGLKFNFKKNIIKINLNLNLKAYLKYPTQSINTFKN